MYNRLRIMIPAVQTLAFVGVFALKFAVKSGAMQIDYYPLQELIWRVNYPVWIVMLGVAYPVDWITGRLPRLSVWLSVLLASIFALVLIIAVAMLWYLAVTEIELRRRGKSMLRFPTAAKRVLTAGLLLLLGGAAIFNAYTYRSSLYFSTGITPLTLAAARADQFTGKLILTAWGVTLIGLAVYDLAVFFSRKAHHATTISF